MAELTDDYFINLTMDYDKRDDEIYPKWAVWCANSDDKYYIDGKDGHFYTHVRTDDEIAKEKKKKANMDFIISQRTKMDLEFGSEEFNKFMEYEEYVRSLEMDEDFLDKEPKSFKEWSK